MPETEPTTREFAEDDSELGRWMDDAEAALDEAIRQHISTYSREHPPPPRPFPVRLTLDAGEVEFLFPDGSRQNARRRRLHDQAA